jgi:hypothetical protein
MNEFDGDIRAQLAAVEVMEREFLTLAWNKGYEGAEERHRRITAALEMAGGCLDIRALLVLFYGLEQVATREMDKLAHLAQAGVEAIKEYQNLPNNLKDNVKQLEEWVKNYKRNKDAARFKRPDRLSRFIEGILIENQEITANEVILKLEKEADKCVDGWIKYNSSEPVFKWESDGGTEETPYGGIKDRLSKARKRTGIKKKASIPKRYKK